MCPARPHGSCRRGRWQEAALMYVARGHCSRAAAVHWPRSRERLPAVLLSSSWERRRMSSCSVPASSRDLQPAGQLQATCPPSRCPGPVTWSLSPADVPLRPDIGQPLGCRGMGRLWAGSWVLHSCLQGTPGCQFQGCASKGLIPGIVPSKETSCPGNFTLPKKCNRTKPNHLRKVDMEGHPSRLMKVHPDSWPPSCPTAAQPPVLSSSGPAVPHTHPGRGSPCRRRDTGKVSYPRSFLYNNVIHLENREIWVFA